MSHLFDSILSSKIRSTYSLDDSLHNHTPFVSVWWHCLQSETIHLIIPSKAQKENHIGGELKQKWERSIRKFKLFTPAHLPVSVQPKQCITYSTFMFSFYHSHSSIGICLLHNYCSFFLDLTAKVHYVCTVCFNAVLQCKYSNYKRDPRTALNYFYTRICRQEPLKRKTCFYDLHMKIYIYTVSFVSVSWEWRR